MGTPVKVLDQVKWADVTENEVKAAIRTDGSLWMWGLNERGQLGNGRQWDEIWGGELYQSQPVKIMDDVAQVSLDLYCTAAVQTDGSLWTWGESENGQLGNGDAYDEVVTKPGKLAQLNCQSVPMKILDNIAQVTMDNGVGRAIDRDGGLWMWGNNWRGALGNGGESDYRVRGFGCFICPKTTPVKVMDGVTQVSGFGNYRTAAVTTDGNLWMWGELGEAVSNDTRESFSISINGSGSDSDLKPVPIQTVPHLFEKEELTSLFFVSDSPDGSDSPHFRDVGGAAYFFEPVYWCVARGITTGTGPDTFGPNDTCTRAQIVTFLWRAHGSSAAPTAPFTDVDSRDYYAGAAAWAYQQGLVTGTQFGGDTPCTRGATVVYLWKLAGQPDASTAPFNDVPTGSDEAKAASWALAEGITAGTGEGTFGPEEICTRGEIMTFLYRDLAL